jgi:hypothetical protein
VDPDGQYFVDRLRERLSCIPELSDKIDWEETGSVFGDIVMDVDIPKLTEDGFDIGILLADYCSIIQVAAEGCVVEFFLSSNPKHAQRNRQEVDRAIALVYGLLGSDYRVRTLYRGGEAYKAWFEKREGGKWKKVAWTRWLLWFRHFFANRTEVVLQNRVIKTA